MEKQNILTWPKSKIDSFGRFLEKEFAHKDKKFNSTLKKYTNQGDPCNNTKAYYEGLEFPQDKEKIKLVHPQIKAIQLTWEHGELQGLTIYLQKKFNDQEIQKMFNLPKDTGLITSQHKNIMSYSIFDCDKASRCLSLQGFEHVGASEAGCGD